MTKFDRRARAAEAFRLTNELAHDLRAGVEAYRFFQKEASNEFLRRVSFIALTRLCLFHIVACLAKVLEFYQHYKAVLPEDLRPQCLEVYRETQSRGVAAFRNKILWVISGTTIGSVQSPRQR